MQRTLSCTRELRTISISPALGSSIVVATPQKEMRGKGDDGGDHDLLPIMFLLSARKMRAISRTLCTRRLLIWRVMAADSDSRATWTWFGWSLLCLPHALLGCIWPEARIVTGLRVFKFIRQKLPGHGDPVLLSSLSRTMRFFLPLKHITDQLLRDFSPASHLKAELKWQGHSGGLMCVASLGTALCLVDLAGMLWGVQKYH